MLTHHSLVGAGALGLRWVSRLQRQVSEQRAVISQHTREIGDLWEALAQLERANAQGCEKL